MRSVNKVILIGNLTRDPVVKTTPQGIKYVTWGMATNRTVVSKNTNEKKQLAEFHECASFKPWIVSLAEHSFLRKGKYIFVEGYLKTRSWENENGQKTYRTEVNVDTNLIMLHPNPERSNGNSAPAEVGVAPVSYEDEPLAPAEAEDDLF
ncbi:MAG: single-stranded DNA-binding protein, single-strand DNA-binding protein [Candidatus Peregrinibacteria bacterium GW2011_GWF2_33_10]|nr:MAG: single-stranded DNA-binding protein, single-strand DNA-binding protein [Candidatus Peregrinibacteria bacterium GW2011_GWF2_33_10]OGJ44947.1 MAG: hypothetical protein A2272_02790 [Candidatus Peregrinibacteria bacterium RIFOXYA12_FULL_33_12]OGJ45245.1 MAG: hypothetical protein A2263_06765 [Candidatus Peregrinibacteria bacterium RIFOXYA2_FULL_33_21]OGJ51169.1 MAG: hypothetical protein A2307_04850 [Candidatus Peregrinibacteria bacterium RIFOXYB2_FULL_33_20]